MNLRYFILNPSLGRRSLFTRRDMGLILRHIYISVNTCSSEVILSSVRDRRDHVHIDPYSSDLRLRGCELLHWGIGREWRSISFIWWLWKLDFIKNIDQTESFTKELSDSFCVLICQLSWLRSMDESVLKILQMSPMNMSALYILRER